jgi:hypothetical protein
MNKYEDFLKGIKGKTVIKVVDHEDGFMVAFSDNSFLVIRPWSEKGLAIELGLDVNKTKPTKKSSL